jgi:hypothetical protein
MFWDSATGGFSSILSSPGNAGIGQQSTLKDCISCFSACSKASMENGSMQDAVYSLLK